MANISISKEDRRFEFGKYNGFTVKEIILKDPSYIEFMSSKVNWLFTSEEKQELRNFRSRQKNKDVNKKNDKSRSSFENEMYHIFRNL